MPRAAYSAWRVAFCAGRTVQARAAGAWATIGTTATGVTHRADACGAASGGSGSGRRMPLARRRMDRQPIQLPRCSAAVVPKRLRDFWYARPVGARSLGRFPRRCYKDRIAQTSGHRHFRTIRARGMVFMYL